ncbi:type I restriction-modification system subunit M N-terminal domain-containing protein [Helicobacter sp. faydin-H76]|uniref:Type I restriction-modification system subunit M N-terminal domain-containing protein n=1 Tax=Helicobacter cappadocius TaxID=3063998 RepID=A0AA90PTJ9_9HELI|nr:type I restriction-modification system subunit M N-terminal domain-containing protein [Helicobacter sp. faydin-H76]MDP2539294.1 type I restriction-modification system subunit M N-terminal domain-containing protein [Helicobacter sp. faydin-H76]
MSIDNKKEQERAALHKMIWDLANDLRGAVSGWDFKQYILGILFYRFISENIKEYVNKVEHEMSGGGGDKLEIRLRLYI